jgi:hypothetical protein
LLASLLVSAPTSDGNNVVRILRVRSISEHAAFVVNNRFGIDSGSDRPPNEDLRHDAFDYILIKINETVLGDCGIREVIDLRTGTAHACESVACFACRRSADRNRQKLAKC